MLTDSLKLIIQKELTKKDKLRGTRFDDDIYGKAGDDVINAKSGDDWIYPGSSKRKGDIKTGKGYDVIIANPNGYAHNQRF